MTECIAASWRRICPGVWRGVQHDLGREKGLAASARARSRHPQCPPSAQAGRQLAAQHPSPLDEQRLINGFMADAHGPIVWEVDAARPKPAPNLSNGSSPGFAEVRSPPAVKER